MIITQSKPCFVLILANEDRALLDVLFACFFLLFQANYFVNDIVHNFPDKRKEKHFIFY